jgi:hypothetical protein
MLGIVPTSEHGNIGLKCCCLLHAIVIESAHILQNTAVEGELDLLEPRALGDEPLELLDGVGRVAVKDHRTL